MQEPTAPPYFKIKFFGSHHRAETTLPDVGSQNK